MKRLIHMTAIIVLMLSALVALGIKTHEVNIGFGNNYDERVLITRDATGRMLFKDDTVSTYVTLLQLCGGVSAHSALSGLGADDHTQYLTSGRHSATHTAAYNDSLAISPDVNSNTTLGTHTSDAKIHVNRANSEEISGGWRFTGTPEFQNNVRLSHGGAAGDASVTFESGATDATIAWNSTDATFELNKPLKGTTAEFGVGKATEVKVVDNLDGSDGQGNPSATLSGFEAIEGIPSSNLVDKSADEDISGQWDFMSNVRLFKTITSLSSYLYGFTIAFNAYANSSEAQNGLNRWGAQICSYFQNQGSGAVSYSSNIGVEGKAQSTGKTSTGESINDVRVAGIAASQSSQTNAVGVAGFTDQMATNRARIGVYGGMDSGVLVDPSALPQGEWAGYFAGNLGFSGTISGNGAGLTGIEKAKGKTKTVAKSGADFSTIQSAINSITDASPTNPYTIIICPGVYEEQVTLKSYVNLAGISMASMDSSFNIVSGTIVRKNQSGSGPAGAVVGGNAVCSLENLAIENTKSTYASYALNCDGGAVTVHNCILKSGHADTVTFTAGSHVIQSSWIVGGYDTISTYADLYLHDSTLINQGTPANSNLWISGSPTLRVERCEFRNTGVAEAFAVNIQTDTATLYFTNNHLGTGIGQGVFVMGTYSPTIYAGGNTGGGYYNESFSPAYFSPIKIETRYESDVVPITAICSGDATGDVMNLKLAQAGGEAPTGDFLQCDYDATTRAKIDKSGNFSNTGCVDSASFVDGATGFRVNGNEVIDANRVLKNIAKWEGDCVYNDSQFDVRADTGDGSDNKAVAVCGGGWASDTRGATALFYGNESATAGTKGKAVIAAGNAYSSGDDGTILFYTAGAEAARIDRDKGFTVQSEILAPNMGHADNGETVVWAGSGYLRRLVACPRVLARVGETWVECGRILRNLDGFMGTSYLPLEGVKNARRYRIVEDVDEVSYIDAVWLVVVTGRGNEVTFRRVVMSSGPQALAAEDGKFLMLRKGDSVEIAFPQEGLPDAGNVMLAATGFHVNDVP
jgi:hypothetical protein